MATDTNDVVEDIMLAIVLMLPDLADNYRLELKCPPVDTVEDLLNRREPLDPVDPSVTATALSALALELIGSDHGRAWVLDDSENPTGGDTRREITRDELQKLFMQKCTESSVDGSKKADSQPPSVRYEVDECIGICQDSASPAADRLPIVVHISDEAMFYSLTKASIYQDLHPPKVNAIVQPKIPRENARRLTKWTISNVCVDRAKLVPNIRLLTRFLALSVFKEVDGSGPAPSGKPPVDGAEWQCKVSAGAQSQ